MSYFTESRSADVVNGRIGPGTDPRLSEIICSLTRHLHDFVR